MPRTVDEILQHADEFAARLEQYEPSEADEPPDGVAQNQQPLETDIRSF